MSAKDDNIKRLQELAVLLGRKADISGSAAEIQQRLAEWEEEAADLDDDGDGQHHTSNKAPGGEVSPTGWVAVQVLKTLHIPALTLDGREISDAVDAGSQVQIRECHFSELNDAGLVRAA